MLDSTFQSFFVNATLSMLNLLNSNFNYDMRISGEKKKFKVPIYFSNSNDENFMRDFFSSSPEDCVNLPRAEGNYDIVPRGILNIQNIQIQTNKTTNPFIRVVHSEMNLTNEKRKSEAFSSRLRAIPIEILFDLEIKTNTLTSCLQVVESLIAEYSGVKSLTFLHNSIKIPSQCLISKNPQLNRAINFTYSDGLDRSITIKTTIRMETFLPVMDKNTTLSANNVIEFVDGPNFKLNTQ